MINANRLGKLDELHRAGTRRDAEFVVEEEGCSTSFLPPRTSAHLPRARSDWAISWALRPVLPRHPTRSDGAGAGSRSDQAEGPAMTVPQSAYGAPTSAGPALTDITWIGEADVSASLTNCVEPGLLGAADTPHLPEKSRPRLGVRTSVVGVLALVLLIATLGTGFIALKQNTAAGQWRRHDHSEMRVNSALSADLASAHATIASVNSEKTELKGQQEPAGSALLGRKCKEDTRPGSSAHPTHQ